MQTEIERLKEQIRLLDEELSAVKEESASLKEFIDSVPGFGFAKDVNLTYVSANRPFCDLLKIPYDQIRGKKDHDIFPADLAEKYIQDDKKVIQTGKSILVEEITYNANTDSRFVVATRKHPWFDKNGRIIGLYGFGFDITEIKKAEEHRIKLEEQLRQTQKMESVGRLAGGVAHDFNNMLTVILGCANWILDQIDAKHEFYEDMVEIRKAAERSSHLARQLLAFARKQPIAPKNLDLNDTVTSMLAMIRRLIGEDVYLVWNPSSALWPVNIDPSQIDQIVANLCINARDAINGPGQIVIDTDNVTLDEGFCEKNEGFTAGDYVCLSVRDNGSGMDKATMAHIFEPFFTTKAHGDGTGLGLATVYGIVSQNKGSIKVVSEPGRGASFSIYLPRYLGSGEEEGPVESGRAVSGQEAVLLVEDEPAVLRMTAKMLQSLGYRVLPASKPGDAVELAKQNAGKFHLLMTDVKMPGMNGAELAETILEICPDVVRLFMSGYTANIIPDHGDADPGAHFIQKPFSRDQLAAKLREILDNTAPQTL